MQNAKAIQALKILSVSFAPGNFILYLFVVTLFEGVRNRSMLFHWPQSEGRLGYVVGISLLFCRIKGGVGEKEKVAVLSKI